MVLALILATGLVWTRYQRMQNERASLPLSSREYVQASSHNLSLLERENRLIRWLLPVVIPAILAGTVWMLRDTLDVFLASGGNLGLLATFMVGMLGWAAWKAYDIKPRRLKAERAALEALDLELRSE